MESFFCILKLKFWDVEISIVSCAITRNFNPLIILVPEALRVLFINYFVCHETKKTCALSGSLDGCDDNKMH